MQPESLLMMEQYIWNNNNNFGDFWQKVFLSVKKIVKPPSGHHKCKFNMRYTEEDAYVTIFDFSRCDFRNLEIS